MKIRFVALSIFLLNTIGSLNGQNVERTLIKLQKFESHIELQVNDGKYIIKPYNDKIIETSFIPLGESFNSYSHALVLLPADLETEIVESDGLTKYITPGIKVLITHNPFKISYLYKEKEIISEKFGYQKTSDFEVLSFELDQKEKLFGGGARVLGMNRRGNRLQLYNRAHYGYTTHSELMNFTMPVVVSSKMYTIHFDNAPIGYLDLDSKGNNTLKYETISGRKTYQIVVGDSWEDLINQFTNLTGKQPLPPQWALGNFSSRFGYHSEKEVRETVNNFIQDSIPLDAVIIDIYWFGPDIKGHMGNLEFFKDSFPTPKDMISDFAKKGVKTVLVTEPFILTTSKRWNEVSAKGLLATDSLGNPFTYDFYFGNTGLLDIYKQESKEWFWSIYKKYTEMGIGGWWGDLGEPEVHPSQAKHAVGTADEVHNIYGHDWTKLIFDGYQRDFPEKRPFILMRAGYSGSQKYGMIPWTGDVSRSWGGLKPQMEISLQMGLQGIAYMHSDLGGFAGGEEFNPELYTRWLQYGVFQPIYRPHAQEHIASEPVFHDEKTKSLARKSINLRYSLLPYNYTIAFENSKTGVPLMRPLFFEEPQNDSLFDVSQTYLWGDNFLVSPVVSAGVKKKEVYFPKDHLWYDFFTEKSYKGGQKHSIEVQEEHIPVFVKAGSFIPMVEPVQSTKYYDTKNLDIHYYSDTNSYNSSGYVYHDDGITPNAFEKEMYEILNFNSSGTIRNLLIEFSSECGSNYSATNRNVNFIIHKLNKKPKRVAVNKTNVNFDWNQEEYLLKVPFKWLAGEDVQILIELDNQNVLK